MTQSHTFSHLVSGDCLWHSFYAFSVSGWVQRAFTLQSLTAKRTHRWLCSQASWALHARTSSECISFVRRCQHVSECCCCQALHLSHTNLPPERSLLIWDCDWVLCAFYILAWLKWVLSQMPALYITTTTTTKAEYKHHTTFSLSSHSIRQLSFLFPLSWSSAVVFSRQMLNAQEKPERVPRMVRTVP